MWGIYFYEIEKIVRDYDISWQKSIDAFYVENPAVIKIREFLEKNQDDLGFNELSYADFIFLSALLVPPCNHALLLALRNRFNKDGLLEIAEKLNALGLIDKKTLFIVGGLQTDKLKTFNAILTDLTAIQFPITKRVIEFISQQLYCPSYIKPCLILLNQYHLDDEETLTVLHQHADVFSFIYLAIQALALIQDGKYLTKQSLNLILDNDNSILLSTLLPIFKTADFFTAQTLELLCSHLFQAGRIKEVLGFLLRHDCLDKSILRKLLRSEVSLAYHVEFIASLLKGCDLLHQRNIRRIFLLPDDYYLRIGLAKIAEDNLLNAYVFHLITSNADCQDRIALLSRQGEATKDRLLAALNMEDVIIQRSYSCEDLRFFSHQKNKLTISQVEEWKIVLGHQ